MDKKGLSFLKKDKKLGKIIGTIAISPLEEERDVFQDLVRSVIGQQLSVKAAATISVSYTHLTLPTILLV